MRTHELARAIEKLAKILLGGPDVPAHSLPDLIRFKSRDELGPDEIKIGLSHLVALSRVDKKKWADLIEEYGFPIVIRPRDASRDVLGKLLRYLEKTPDARERLRHTSPSGPTKASPELLKALSTLLKD